MATLLSAVVIGLFSLVVSLLGLRKENKDDHAFVRVSIDHLTEGVERLSDGIERVESKVDEHVTDHARGVL